MLFLPAGCALCVLDTQPVGTGPAKSHRIKLPISFAATGFNGWECLQLSLGKATQSF